jgi:parvulin-like peptidyl-prolyl isomerase
MRFLPSLRNRISARAPLSHAPTRPLRRSRTLWIAAGLLGSCCLIGQVEADAAGSLVATFTGGAITQADLETVVTQRLPVQKDLLQREGAVHDVLESMVRYDLLVSEAEARGYRDHVRVRTASQAKANELLMLAHATVEPGAISKSEVERAYSERRREFSRPPLRRASHVLLPTRAAAEALIAELKGATRERFARVATDKSQDPTTKNQGGELGYFDRDGKTERGVAGFAVPQLAAAAFELRAVGEITREPVAVPQGFSVLMLTGEMPAFETTRAEADERLREQLAKEQGTAKFEALVAELREQHKPVVHAELVDLIVLPPAEPTQIPSGFPAAPPDPREPPKLVEPDGI